MTSGFERVEDEPVADCGLLDRDPVLGHGSTKAEVRHHGHDDRVVAEPAALAQIDGADGDDLVTVDDLTVGVDGHDTVGVAVEGESHVGVLVDDRLAQIVRMCGSAGFVDVRAVRLGVHRGDVGTEAAHHVRCDRRGGAVGAVDHHT